MIQGSLSIIYAGLVILVVLVALKVSIDAFRKGGLPTSEAEDIPSKIYAPRSFFPTAAEKEVLDEWKAAGLDPSPQGVGHSRTLGA
jgi:carbon starvation protein